MQFNRSSKRRSILLKSLPKNTMKYFAPICSDEKATLNSFITNLLETLHNHQRKLKLTVKYLLCNTKLD